MFHFRMRSSTSRRKFLLSAPLAAAAASLPFAATQAAAQLVQTGLDTPLTQKPNEPFRLITAQTLQSTAEQLQAHPGTHNLIEPPTYPLTIFMQSEEKSSPKDFEWHEFRDHVFYIVDGTTVYELGGTPQNPRNTKPGEWLATTVTGAKTVTLSKGDMLVVPRGMPHKRTTTTSVTLILISDTAPSPTK